MGKESLTSGKNKKVLIAQRRIYSFSSQVQDWPSIITKYPSSKDTEAAWAKYLDLQMIIQPAEQRWLPLLLHLQHSTHYPTGHKWPIIFRCARSICFGSGWNPRWHKWPENLRAFASFASWQSVENNGRSQCLHFTRVISRVSVFDCALANILQSSMKWKFFWKSCVYVTQGSDYK